MLTHIRGVELTSLWFNLLVHIATGDHSHFFHPAVFARRVFGSTTTTAFKDPIMEKDFYRFSGYHKDLKLARLRESYFSDKVQAQHNLLVNNIRGLQPRQARGLISFTEPAFNKTDRLKCLDSLFIQKLTMIDYEALIVFRNTEIFPKTYMDFVFLYDLLVSFIPKRVRCVLFSCFLTSSFINMHQAPLAAMFLRKYGITSWNTPFRETLIRFKKTFGDTEKEIKMQYIAKAVNRTRKIMEEDGINLEMLIE